MGVLRRHGRGTRAGAVLAAAIALLLGWGAGARAAAPSLEVQGNRLVDTTTGATFVPRGVDWPSFEYACQQGWGYSAAGTGAADVALIAAWHINTVRVPLNQDCWLGDDGLPAGAGRTSAGYRAAVGQFVATLHAAGIAVILDLHWSGPAGVIADGQRAMPDARSGAFWTSVATAFHDDPAVIFDAFNEPYSRYDGVDVTFDLTWECWRTGTVAGPPSAACDAPRQNDTESPFDGVRFPIAGMQELVTAIRATGATQPIMVAGRDYANDLGGWLAHAPDDPAHALVASFHNYLGQACHTAACWDATIAPVAAQVPVVTGEFGQTDCHSGFVTSFMDWADAHGVGYLAWAWWVLGTVHCSQLAVISDAAGTPQAPNGTALKAHLEALAAAPPATTTPAPPTTTIPAPPPDDPAAPPGDPIPPGTTTPAPPPATPAARGRLRTRTATLHGRTIVLSVACGVAGPCRGSITLDRGATRLATGRWAAAAGRATTARLTLTRRQAAAVARFGRRGRDVRVTMRTTTAATSATLRLRGR